MDDKKLNKDFLNMIYSWFNYPEKKICRTFVALDTLAFMLKHGLKVPKELIVHIGNHDEKKVKEILKLEMDKL